RSSHWGTSTQAVLCPHLALIYVGYSRSSSSCASALEIYVKPSFNRFRTRPGRTKPTSWRPSETRGPTFGKNWNACPRALESEQFTFPSPRRRLAPSFFQHVLVRRSIGQRSRSSSR